MSLPATVQVGAYAYTIQVCAEIGRDLGHDGNHNRTLQRIRLNPSQGPDSLRDTLLHEILHAVCSNSGLDGADEEFKKVEEQFIYLVVPGLLGVIRDNPLLLAYLQERV